MIGSATFGGAVADDLAATSAFNPGLVVYNPLSDEKFGPALEAARRVGVRDVVCVDGRLKRDAVERTFHSIFGSSRGAHVTLFSPDRLLDGVPPEFLHHSWGVLPAHEIGVEGAATFSRSLKAACLLANPDAAHSPEATQILRDKILFRRLINKVVAPLHPEVQSIWNGNFLSRELSVESLRTAGAPDKIVVKPRNASGSRGVELIDLRAPEAQAKLASIRSTLEYLKTSAAAAQIDVEEVEVEEFVDGEEFAIDGFRKDGQTHVSIVNWKPDMYRDFGRSGQFLEGTFVSLPSDAPWYPSLVAVNEIVLSAIPGLGEGNFHAEYRIDPTTGKVFPIEIAGRIGGGSIYQSAKLVSGVNLYDAAILLASGLEVPVPTAPNRVTGDGIVFPQNDGELSHFWLNLPGEEPLEVFDADEASIADRLSRFFRRVPRSVAAGTFDNLVEGVPFPSDFRAQLIGAFDPNGEGLDVAVNHFLLWSQQGAPVIGFAGFHTGGFLLSSSQGSADVRSLADVMAAMGLALAAFRPEVVP